MNDVIAVSPHTMQRMAQAQALVIAHLAGGLAKTTQMPCLNLNRHSIKPENDVAMGLGGRPSQWGYRLINWHVTVLAPTLRTSVALRANPGNKPDRQCHRPHRFPFMLSKESVRTGKKRHARASRVSNRVETNGFIAKKLPPRIKNLLFRFDQHLFSRYKKTVIPDNVLAFKLPKTFY